MKKFLTLSLAALLCAACTTLVYQPPTLDEYKDAALKEVNELVAHASISNFPKEHKRKARIGIGKITNDTHKGAGQMRIDIEQVSLRIREALLNSGQLEIVDDNSPNGAPADYYLEGRIGASVVKGADGKDIRKYSFTLSISDINKSGIVWQHTADVQGSYKEL
ncbi:MAG: penicillin-binding protein activator LpoB [Puniceicoccales bacterium]|jgi:hypothetical protein|nr:penicillin-binding protein activator LpoB [Puniceicoccales bacterium]